MKSMACLAACLLAAALSLTACGEKPETTTAASRGHQESLSVMLDWFPNVDHVGLYQALADGDFRQVGLNVQVRTPSDPSLPLKLLQAGTVDLAISYEPELLLARDRGLPLVAVAALVQEPLTSIVSVGSEHITRPARLRGKRVGDAGIAYQHAYLDTILARAGVPTSSVHEVNVGANLVPAMLSGRVNATLGAFWNVEAIQLAQLHKHPNVIRMDRVGVPTYDELVLVAKQSTIITKADFIRRFVQALGRGYESARRDPAGAVNNLLATNPGLERSFQLAALRVTLPAFFPADASRPWGWQNEAQWTAYGQWMLSQHLISHPTAVVGAESNDFLAGVGP